MGSDASSYIYYAWDTETLHARQNIFSERQQLIPPTLPLTSESPSSNVA